MFKKEDSQGDRVPVGHERTDPFVRGTRVPSAPVRDPAASPALPRMGALLGCRGVGDDHGWEEGRRVNILEAEGWAEM